MGGGCRDDVLQAPALKEFVIQGRIIQRMPRVIGLQAFTADGSFGIIEMKFPIWVTS